MMAFSHPTERNFVMIRTALLTGLAALALTGYGYRVRCLIPNPAEESRVFRMRCVRIGGSR